MAKIKRGLGWLPDLPDDRDYESPYPTVARVSALPKAFSFADKLSPVYDQKTLGSCTAQAACAAIRYQELTQKVKGSVEPSRLFVYYNSRILQGTEEFDSGASIRNSVRSLAKYGYCKEASLKYVLANFANEPYEECYEEAYPHKLTSFQYERVTQDTNHIKSVIASGEPILYGFTVYDNFGTDAKGLCPMPKGSVQGGHAVMICGYDDFKKAFLVRNSWGAKWGLKGYFWHPYDYVLSKRLASDFWTIRSVT